MSENLDLVRSIYAAWERGDFGHAAEWADADIEYVLAGGGPADGSWRGLDGMAEGFRNYLSAWEDFRVQADEYRELDDGRVLVLTWYSGRGKTSGLNLGSTGERGATLFHVRGHVVTRLVTYATSDSALADLGLEECAMSQENVEIVAAASKAWAEGGLDAYAEFWHPDINWRAIEGAPDDVGEMQGTEAARRYIQDWLDLFEDLTNVAEEPLDVGGERVVAVHHVTGRARLSGIETELHYAAVYTLREGKIVRVREYRDREQALKAVGLAE